MEINANGMNIKQEEPVVLRSDLQPEMDQNVFIKTEVKNEDLWEDGLEEREHQPEPTFETVNILQITKEESVSEYNGIDLPSSESTRLNTEVGYYDESCTSTPSLERLHSPQEKVSFDGEPSSVYTAHGQNDNRNPPLEYNHQSKDVEPATQLVENKVTQESKRKHKCDYCEKSFKKKYDLMRHMWIHSGIKPYKCDSCHKSFNKKSTLNRHSLIHLGIKPYKCDSCGKSFSEKASLNVHIRNHTGVKPYKCNRCEKSFNVKASLKRHIVIHLGIKPYKCDICNKSYNIKSNFLRHAACHSSKKNTSENNTIDKDLLSLEPTRLNSEAGYYDESCTSTSPLEKVQSPQGKVTSDFEPSSVHTAHGKSDNQESSLRQNFCSIDSDPSVEYDHHNTSIESSAELVENRIPHESNRVHKCEYCEKSFKRKYDLDAHLLIHSGVKPYKCDSCDKSFNKKGSLKRHRLIHSGIKLYKCDSCEKSFSDKARLNRHVVNHSGVRPYKCDMCEKSFIDRTTLNRHMVIHLGIKPYKCDICNKSYNNQSNLIRHAACHSSTENTSENNIIAKDPLSLESTRLNTEVEYYDESCTSILPLDGVHSPKREVTLDCEPSNVYAAHGEDENEESQNFSSVDHHNDVDESAKEVVKKKVTYDSRRVHKCVHCEKRFKRKSELRRHTLVHSGVRPFKCDDCQKSFSNKTTLSRHTVIHLGIKPYKCDICNKSYNNQSNLIRHAACHSSKENTSENTTVDKDPLSLESTRLNTEVAYCDESCTSILPQDDSPSLTQNFSSVNCDAPLEYDGHNNDVELVSELVDNSNIQDSKRVHRCAYCERRFRRKSELRRHTLTHLGIKPFKCDSCQKSFSNKANLNRHFVIHLGIKPYKCDICNKSYNNQSNMIRHAASHSSKENTLENNITDKDPLSLDSTRLNTEVKLCDESCANSLDGVESPKREITSDCKQSSEDTTVAKSDNSALEHDSELASELVDNTNTHDSKRVHRCAHCGKRFKRKSELNRHTLIHSGVRPYKCDSCEKSFSNRTTLNRHIVIHLGIKPYKCKICNKSYNNQSNLIRHAACHSSKKNTSAKHTIDKDPLSLDSTRLNTEVEYYDESCASILPLDGMHSPKREVSFDCEPSSVYTTHGANDNVQSCSVQNYFSLDCNPPLNYHKDVESAEDTIIPDIKDVESPLELIDDSITYDSNRVHRCVYCEKRFKRKSELKRHILIHLGIRPYKCDSCPKTFKRKPELDTHMLSHFGIKPFKCDVCTKSFNNKASLIRHNVIHSGTRPYKCATCGKGFNASVNLKAHEVCHLGIKPFKCNTCNKSFNNKSNLIRHASSHSVGQYKCTDCDKRFPRKSELIRHSLCHSNIKPYSCVYCEKTFKHKTHLNRHVLSHSV